MTLRALVFFVLAAGSSAFAQSYQYSYDADGDGDIDGDDWEVMQPPSTEGTVYAGEQAPRYAPTQQQFEQQLSGYGAWYDEPGVGRVWQPSPREVGSDFSPYTTGGSWVSTTGGWQFATTYRFGSAPFHYGRWYQSPRFGWVWWPQYTWAPHWVDWRTNRAGNVAWAPMTPPGIRLGFSAGQPGWSFAYGRHHRPHMSSFSWGRDFGAHGYYARPGRRYGNPGHSNPGNYHSASPAGGYGRHGGRH